ncbi:MAG: pseudouridine synthase, RluA family [Bacteroidetes bacterium]|jgi:23S rRNA pseudouridine1911/1915/1917 synthase|nr:pseudouridine synthase, RluA family [Bacteroidota bacterium]
MEDFEDVDDAGSEESQGLYEHHNIIVDKGQYMERIDKFIMMRLSNTTRTKIQHACDAGFVLVNKKPVKSSYKIKPLDEISIVLTVPPRDVEVVPENIPVDIVYEDDYIVLVNKKPGMVVHPGYGNYRGTLVNALAYHFQNLPKTRTKLNNDQYMERPGLVHRIDKNTSGIIIIAKTELAMTRLAKDFYDRTMDRKYVAIVWGDVKQDSGTIVGNVGRNLKNRKVMDVFPEGSEHGKHAVTHYKVLERFGYITFVECKLETGRTHQIRVHFKHIGHPLFNDNEYGGDVILKGLNTAKYRQFIQNCFDLLPRQALHAKTLGITHPITGEKLFFDSEIPDDMQAVLEKWRKYMKDKELD